MLQRVPSRPSSGFTCLNAPPLPIYSRLRYLNSFDPLPSPSGRQLEGSCCYIKRVKASQPLTDLFERLIPLPRKLPGRTVLGPRRRRSLTLPRARRREVVPLRDVGSVRVRRPLEDLEPSKPGLAQAILGQHSRDRLSNDLHVRIKQEKGRESVGTDGRPTACPADAFHESALDERTSSGRRSITMR